MKIKRLAAFLLQVASLLALMGTITYLLLTVEGWQQVGVLTACGLFLLARRPRFMSALLNIVSAIAAQLSRMKFSILWGLLLVFTAGCFYRSMQPWGSRTDAAVAVMGGNLLVFAWTFAIRRWRGGRVLTAALATIPGALFLSVVLVQSPQAEHYNEGRKVFDSGRGDPVSACKQFEQSTLAYGRLRQRPPLLKFLYGGEDQVLECQNRYEAAQALIAQRKPDKAVEFYLEALTVLPPNSPIALREAPDLPLDVIRALEKLWLKGGGGGGRGQQPGAMQKPEMRPQFGTPQPHDDN